MNRQRSLYQAGKLRKDRQQALEKVGLKWSMLATTSWESMYDTLCDYVQSKAKDVGDWDGNVPANYRTEDNPPRALGRWINRQRSAYGKDKLKGEYIEKLNRLGLKWSVHERRPLSTPDSIKSTPTPTTTPSSRLAVTAILRTPAAQAVNGTGETSALPAINQEANLAAVYAAPEATARPPLCPSTGTASGPRQAASIPAAPKPQTSTTIAAAQPAITTPTVASEECSNATASVPTPDVAPSSVLSKD